MAYISIKDKPQLLGFIPNQNIIARGTYIFENLTQPEIEMMLLLDEYELDIFNLEELKEMSYD